MELTRRSLLESLAAVAAAITVAGWTLGGIGPPPPNAYVAEDGSTFYVGSGGGPYIIQES